jgi:hypothetical protein
VNPAGVKFEGILSVRMVETPNTRHWFRPAEKGGRSRPFRCVSVVLHCLKDTPASVRKGNDARHMDQKKLILTLVVVAGAIVIAAGSSASGYRWVAYRKMTCGGVAFGGLPCNRTILVQPNPAPARKKSISSLYVVINYHRFHYQQDVTIFNALPTEIFLNA